VKRAISPKLENPRRSAYAFNSAFDALSFNLKAHISTAIQRLQFVLVVLLDFQQVRYGVISQFVLTVYQFIHHRLAIGLNHEIVVLRPITTQVFITGPFALGMSVAFIVSPYPIPAAYEMAVIDGFVITRLAARYANKLVPRPDIIAHCLISTLDGTGTVYQFRTSALAFHYFNLFDWMRERRDCASIA
jgi:hypothetical protein